MSDAKRLAERGHDGSRGLQPTDREAGLGFVAERRLTCGNRHALSIVADATPGFVRLIRGLKPTVTVIKSLRDCKN